MKNSFGGFFKEAKESIENQEKKEESFCAVVDAMH